MIAFVRDMSDGYKKTSHLKEAIRRSWVPGSPDHRCPESSNGNTVLHVAARMGEAKVGTLCTDFHTSLPRGFIMFCYGTCEGLLRKARNGTMGRETVYVGVLVKKFGVWQSMGQTLMHSLE